MDERRRDPRTSAPSKAEMTSSTVAGAMVRSARPARWTNAAGRRSHNPRQGVVTTSARSHRSERRSLPPDWRHATSSQTWTTIGGRSSVEINA